MVEMCFNAGNPIGKFKYSPPKVSTALDLIYCYSVFNGFNYKISFCYLPNQLPLLKIIVHIEDYTQFRLFYACGGKIQFLLLPRSEYAEMNISKLHLRIDELEDEIIR